MRGVSQGLAPRIPIDHAGRLLLPGKKESEDTAMMWGYVPNGGSWLMMIVGNLFWIALLGLLAWAIISWSGSRAHRLMPQKAETLGNMPSALEILRQRYVHGEIDALTFE